MAERVQHAVASVAALATLVAGAGTAAADKIIDRPGQGPDYSVEIEPHGVLGPFDPPGDSGGMGLGGGLRLSIPILPGGFIKPVNDCVAIGFGFDYVHYDGGGAAVGGCAEWVPGPNGTQICTQVTGHGGPADYFFFPAVMQWNFWLFDSFSAFAEPGLAVYYQTQENHDGEVGIDGIFQVGGRWHFSEVATLTFRVGYPTVTLGVSFLL